MKKFWLVLSILVLLALAGLGVFLALWQIPPPTERMETVIPDDRFSK